ncbi:hypothetical protein L1987_85910 [Smallanthus sonchifolius]|uniref:Uncharacterized protein n=1 Tax=Smallanthus sonchifolius TaxID=185202 RepID=A0ACB8XXT8_9ASTR|nr:hypothetical protein L1987_85910 [Smallanthus sonchifolius]
MVRYHHPNCSWHDHWEITVVADLSVWCWKLFEIVVTLSSVEFFDHCFISICNFCESSSHLDELTGLCFIRFELFSIYIQQSSFHISLVVTYEVIVILFFRYFDQHSLQ